MSDGSASDGSGSDDHPAESSKFDDRDQSLQRRAVEALESGRFDLADELLGNGEVTLAELTHNLRVHQTELKLQAQELRESNVRLDLAASRFRQLFESLPQSAFVTDRFGVVLTANREAERLLGVGVAPTRLATLPRLGSDGAAVARIRGAFVLAELDGAAQEREVELRGEGGQLLLVDLEIERLEAVEPGDDDRYIVLVTDGTERRAEQEQLRLLAAAVSTLEDIVVITDAGPLDEPGPSIVFVNDGFERRTGYSRDEAIGRSPRFLQGPDTDRGELDRIRTALDRQQTVSAELLNYRRDGSSFWVELVIVPVLDRTGVCTHFVAVQRDVSARRQAEERLRQTLRLEALGQLTGGVAHDFNNLLSVILGCADELATDEILDVERRELAEDIRTAAERGADLTRRLLAFGRMQLLKPSSVDVNKCLTKLVDSMLQRTLGAHLIIELELHPGVGSVEIDAAQFEAAIVNLATNARDAVADGGRLRIRTSMRDVEQAEADTLEVAAGPYVAVEMIDDGTGIDASIIASVFDPFFTTKASGKGTGLGLAMVYGFVRQSNGSVSITSSEGEGTTVTMLLPVATRQIAVEASDPVEPHTRADNLLVILVEDEPLVRSIVRTQLISLGYRVREAADGAEALALVAAEPEIALLFTDVLLPGGMDGKALADAVHSLRPGVPVLFTSGFSKDALSTDGRLAPGVHLLEKPYRRADLVAALAAVFDGDPPPI